MNYCQSCLVANDISSCSEALTIGTGTADTAYTVYVKNLSTQRVDVFETVSTAEGLIIIDTTDYTFNEGNPYELWVTLENASPNSHEEIIVGDFTTTCIDFSAIAYKNADDGCVKVIADEILIPTEDSQDFLASDCVCVTEEDVENWNSGGGECCPEYTYRAQVVQNGTPGNDPVATVRSGSNFPAITWTYMFPGHYRATSVGNMIVGKLTVHIQGNAAGDALIFSADAAIGTPDYLDIFCYDLATVLIDPNNFWITITKDV